jgi:hypothetical protein
MSRYRKSVLMSIRDRRALQIIIATNQMIATRISNVVIANVASTKLATYIVIYVVVTICAE